MSGRYITVPLDVIETPRNGEAYADRYWVHMPGAGVLFWNRYGTGKGGFSPQCNGDRRIPEKLLSRYPGAEIVHVPVAYMGRWEEEWGFTLPWYRNEIAEQLAVSDVR